MYVNYMQCVMGNFLFFYALICSLNPYKLNNFYSNMTSVTIK